MSQGSRQVETVLIFKSTGCQRGGDHEQLVNKDKHVIKTWEDVVTPCGDDNGNRDADAAAH